MRKLPTFIRLEGILYESLEFEYKGGYEIYTAQRSIDDSNSLGVTASLADDNDAELVSISPDIRFTMGCAPGMPTVGLHDLRVSLPMHADARSIQLRCNERVLFRREIGKTSPAKVEIETNPVAAGDSISFKLECSRTENTELLFFLETEDQRRYPIVVEPADDSLTIDLKPYAGLGEAELVVRHSSKFRSTESRSTAFQLPERSICGRILEPRANAEIPTSAPFSIIGNVCDQNGRVLNWSSCKVFWCVDGTRIDDARQIALCGPLTAGEHRLELFVTQGDENMSLLDRIIVRTNERTKAQREYDAVVEQYLTSKKSG